MLKHNDITIRRIQQFIQFDLGENLLGAKIPLKIEFCDQPFATEKEAKKGEWKEVQKGFGYGPAYQTFWFRLSGKVPPAFAGEEVGLMAEVGSERTLWKDNSPWLGIDEPHKVVPIINDAKGGEKLELYIQAYSRNPQCRVHRRELPREQIVETVESAEIAVIDRELTDLYYDCEFAQNLMKALEPTDPAHATILRALNDVCNAYSPETRETIARCRKILRDALGSLNGELKHAITPVGHAHLDTAWLWPLDITMKKMAHTTATQLSLIDRYPDYVFVHSQASQYEWLEQQYPVLFQRVKDAVAKGQWEPLGSMWVEADCNLTGAESLVRQFLYGKRYFQKHFNYTTSDMWLPDVFGYSAALPQILAKFNIKYFLTQKISWNQFNRFPHHTFWWQGIDGSRVWSHFPPADTYCADCTPGEILKSVKSYTDHARCDQSLYVFGHGDGGGGPTELHLELLKRGRIAPSLPEIHGSRKALDFFRDAKARSKDLMTWSGELYFEAHRGTYTSQAANKKSNRESEFLLRDAELISCFRDDFPAKYPAKELVEAWKLVLLNQFHDIIPGSSVNEVYRDSRRDYKIVAEMGEKIVQDGLKNIGSKFDTKNFKRPIALYQGATQALTTRVAWKESDAPASITVGDECLPVQLVNDFDGPHLVFPTPQAALGAVAVGDLDDAPPNVKYRLKASNRRIENSELAVRFDANGNITSIESLEDGSEFIEPGKIANLFQIFDDKPLFWSAWDVDVFALETAKDLIRSESFEIVERGPVRVSAQIVKKFGKSTIRQKVSLGAGPGILFDTEIDWHEEDKMLKVAFPVNVHSSRATYEIQFGNVERPTHYNTTWDVARFEVCAQKWVDLSEGDQGVALLNDGKYGHDVHGNVMRITLLRSPKAPDPECDMGVHRFSYMVLPHFGAYNYGGVVQTAYSLNAPTRYAFLDKHSGQTGSLPQFVACEDRNIVIESVKKAEEGSSVIVRLYECHNSRGHAELYCARTPKAAWLCDLEENPLEELDVHEGIVVFPYKPFEIQTIKLDV